MGFFYMKNILKIVFVIIGTLIGAGFASGKEIYTFFYSYGEKGIFGIIISSLLIGIIIYNSLRIIKEKCFLLNLFIFTSIFFGWLNIIIIFFCYLKIQNLYQFINYYANFC